MIAASLSGCFYDMPASWPVSCHLKNQSKLVFFMKLNPITVSVFLFTFAVLKCLAVVWYYYLLYQISTQIFKHFHCTNVRHQVHHFCKSQYLRNTSSQEIMMCYVIPHAGPCTHLAAWTFCILYLRCHCQVVIVPPDQ